jgi:ribosome-associated translation inhibitor RaiA
VSAGELTDDLGRVLKVLAELPGLTPARLELSIEDADVTAQIMADKIAVPLVGHGSDAPTAIRSLVECMEREGRKGRRRLRDRERRSERSARR